MKRIENGSRRRAAVLMALLVIAGFGAVWSAGCIATDGSDNRSAEAGASATSGQETATIGDRFEQMQGGISTRNQSSANDTTVLETTTEPAAVNRTFEESVRDSVDNASESFVAAGTTMRSYDVAVYDLITDPVLAEPGHEGREKGVVVTVFYDRPADPVYDTLWGHEADATRIVERLYESETGDRIGFVAVLFRQNNAADPRMRLLMNAKEAQLFTGIWDGNGYVQMLDWTEAEILPGSGIAWYEDPETALSGAPGQGTSGNAVIYGRETFSMVIEEGADTLSGERSALESAVAAGDTANVRTAADDLTRCSLMLEKNITSMPVSGDSKPIRDGFVSGLADYRRAGSVFWIETVAPQSNATHSGDEYLTRGHAAITAALGGNVQGPDESVTGGASEFADALSLNERYSYQDEQKANDISVKIVKWGIKSGYGITTDGVPEHVDAGYGFKFLTVVVQVTHLGFRGGDGIDRILTPSPDAFTLYANGETYRHSTPDVFIETVGEPYESVYLDRKEMKEGILIFKVPYSFNPEEAFIEADLGTNGKVVWSLG